jgi:hypothetical protein
MMCSLFFDCQLLEDGVLCHARFYFAYCEGAFDARYIHNFQISWINDEAASSEDRTPTARLEPTAEAPKLALPSADMVTQVQFASLAENGYRKLHYRASAVPKWMVCKLSGNSNLRTPSPGQSHAKLGLPCPVFDSTPLSLSNTCSLPQALLAVYFFLAGLAVNQQQLLWIVPLSSACFALCFYAVTAAAMAGLPAIRCGCVHAVWFLVMGSMRKESLAHVPVLCSLPTTLEVRKANEPRSQAPPLRCLQLWQPPGPEGAC